LVLGDLVHCFPSAVVDLLVSNPPYLSDAEYAGLSPSVRDWEPETALAGGKCGLEITLALLADGRRVVKPQGWIMLEIDSSRASELALGAAELGWAEVQVLDDLFGRARYLVARRSE
jgi:release factor glutamine methyltransferase